MESGFGSRGRVHIQLVRMDGLEKEKSGEREGGARRVLRPFQAKEVNGECACVVEIISGSYLYIRPPVLL